MLLLIFKNRFRVWNEVRPPLENDIELALTSEVYLTSLQFRNYDKVQPWMNEAQKKCISWNTFIRIDPTKHQREFIPLPPLEQSFYHNLNNSFTESDVFSNSVYSRNSGELESAAADVNVTDQQSISEFTSEASDSLLNVISSTYPSTDVTFSANFTTSTTLGNNSKKSSVDSDTCYNVFNEGSSCLPGNTQTISSRVDYINKIPSVVQWSNVNDSTGSSSIKRNYEIVQQVVPKKTVYFQHHDYSKRFFSPCNFQKKKIPANVAQKRPRNHCLNSVKSIKTLQRKKLKFEKLNQNIFSNHPKSSEQKQGLNISESVSRLFLTSASTPTTSTYIVHSSHNQSYRLNEKHQMLPSPLFQSTPPAVSTSTSKIKSENSHSVCVNQHFLKNKLTVEVKDAPLSTPKILILQDNVVKPFQQNLSRSVNYLPNDKERNMDVSLKPELNKNNEIKSEFNMKISETASIENIDRKLV